jgi:hypothetical protein
MKLCIRLPHLCKLASLVKVRRESDRRRKRNLANFRGVTPRRVFKEKEKARFRTSEARSAARLNEHVAPLDRLIMSSGAV